LAIGSGVADADSGAVLIVLKHQDASEVGPISRLFRTFLQLAGGRVRAAGCILYFGTNS